MRLNQIPFKYQRVGSNHSYSSFTTYSNAGCNRVFNVARNFLKLTSSSEKKRVHFQIDEKIYYPERTQSNFSWVIEKFRFNSWFAEKPPVGFCPVKEKKRVHFQTNKKIYYPERTQSSFSWIIEKFRFNSWFAEKPPVVFCPIVRNSEVYTPVIDPNASSGKNKTSFSSARIVKIPEWEVLD